MRQETPKLSLLLVFLRLGFFSADVPPILCAFFSGKREKEGGNLSCVSGGALPFPPAGTTKAGQAKTTFHIVWAGTARVRERKEEKGFPPLSSPLAV